MKHRSALTISNFNDPDWLHIGGNGHIVFIRDPVDGMQVLRDTSRIMLFNWCEENCEGGYWVGMGFGKFQLEHDAVLFRLTWGC